MAATDRPDPGVLDVPQILSVMFHPRPDYPGVEPPDGADDLSIPVADGVRVGGRFHPATSVDAPTILFFHGNGEIVSDYDDLGPLYGRMGLHFLIVDYRGYGTSNGAPTAAALVSDAHEVLDFSVEFLAENGRHGPLVVMGRSLGSGPACELAAHRADEIDGLIIESGFAHTLELLHRLGARDLPETAVDPVGNLEKIAAFDKPTLIIHGADDAIIPFSDGRALYEAAGASDKTLLKIDNAGHNDLFLVGMQHYLEAVAGLVRRAAE